MSLIKPTAQKKSAFDATQDSVFYFSVSGGDQVVKNTLTIRLQSDNSVVYTSTEESFQFSHTVPKNTLTNGIYYNYYFTTYNRSGESIESNTVAFHCYTQPILTIEASSTVTASSQEVKVTYSNTEAENLPNEILISLYSPSGDLIESSGNLYSPSSTSLTFSYVFSGLEQTDGSYYRLIATGSTIYGTLLESDPVLFSVLYDNPILFSNLHIETKCDEGYNQIISNFIEIVGTSNKEDLVYLRQLNTDDGLEYIEWEDGFLIEDTSNPRISDWTEATMVELLGTSNYVDWNSGFKVPSNFTLEIWLKPSLIDKVIDLRNADGDGYTITFVRNIPYDKSTVKDYFVLKGYQNNVLQVYKESNYLDIYNNLSTLVVWVKKNGNLYDLKFESIYSQSNTFDWGTSDVEFDKVSDLFWGGESYEKGIEVDPLYNDLSSIFPLTDVKVCNGIFDNIDISSDMSREYSSDKPSWTYKTTLNCSFDGNLSGGNTDLVLSQISGLRIKRREKNTYNWITLYDLDVETVEDLNIIKTDMNIPSNVTQEYALVPMLGKGNEGDYIVVENTPKWRGVFLNNKDTILKLHNGVSIGSISNNYALGTLTAIGSKYPYIIKNGKIDYYTGTVSGQLFGYDFETSGQINRISVVKQIDDFINMLKDDIVVIKDWNGNIWLTRIGDKPEVSYDSNGMAYASIAFSFIEQGQYDSQSDLYENGLIDVEE